MRADDKMGADDKERGDYIKHDRWTPQGDMPLNPYMPRTIGYVMLG